MPNQGSTRLLLSIFLLSALVALLGLSPRAHQADAALADARRALRSEHPAAAAAAVAGAAASLPGQPGLWEQAGRYALQAGEPEKAIPWLEQAAGDLSPEGRLALGDAYRLRGDWAAALQIWQQSLEENGPSVKLLQRLQELHRAQGQYQRAIEDIRMLIILQPGDAQWRYQLGLLLATQDPEGALSHLAQAAERDPTRSTTVSSLRQSIISARRSHDPAYSLVMSGRALAGLGEWDLAAEAFRQATLLTPEYAEAWAYLAEAWQHLEPDSPQRSDSLEALKRALQLDPRSLSAQLFLALYWSRQDNIPQALETLDVAAEIDPRNPVIYAQQGDLYATQGDLEQAALQYQQAIQYAPRDPAYLRNLASFALNNDYQVTELALPAARQAVILNANDPANLDLMGLVLLELGDLVNAERFLLRALAMQPDFAPAHLHLGQLYFLRGDSERAAAAIHQAAELSPHSDTAEQSARLLKAYFP